MTCAQALFSAASWVAKRVSRAVKRASSNGSQTWTLWLRHPLHCTSESPRHRGRTRNTNPSNEVHIYQLWWLDLISCSRCSLSTRVHTYFSTLISKLVPLVLLTGWYRKLSTVKSLKASLYGGQFTLSTQLIILNYPVILSHRRSTTVSLVTYTLYSQLVLFSGAAFP